MATKKKLLEAAAGAAGGGGLNVEDVFSTYLYDGASSGDIQIQNGVDLDGEGGLVWTKGRSLTTNHFLTDTERGGTKSVFSNLTNAEATNANLMSFNSDGFTLGSGAVGWSAIAGNGEEYASWTFRKAPKFFDVVTYTGNGVDNRQIPHNLGSVPGVIIVKATSSADQWPVYHRSLGTGALRLNLTNAYNSANIWWKATPTDSHFTVYGGGEVNVSGVSYVAYLFAHNDGDGEFGPTGDQDIIKCGSYTGNGSSDGQFIDLGFEPQWLLVKKSSAADNWILMDNMRGMVTSSPVYNSDDETLRPNTTGAEVTSNDISSINPTGFTIREGGNSLNSSSATYIYIAIRRGPMAAPESATDVFDVDALNNPATTPGWQSGFPVDMYLSRRTDNTVGHFVFDRLRGDKYLQTSDADSEATDTAYMDYMDGVGPAGNITTFYSWMWRRAPGFFDVVAYTGDGTASHTINHNLGVVPEMIWTKNRSSATALDWSVYHSGIGRKLLILNNTDAETSYNFFTYDPTSSTWIVRNHPTTNTSGDDYIMYLFASLDGVSKVGSYTGNYGTATTVDCGFSAGSRMVIIKSTSSGGWYIMDTERGIGYDLQLNSTDQQYGANNYISNHSTGFTVNSTSPLNISGTYIFYAIA